MTNSIRTAIDFLVNTLKRLDAKVDFVPANPELLASCKSKYDFPPDLITWYSIAEPINFEIPRPAENLKFIALSRFEYSLEGYAYYYKDKTKIIIDAWDSSWLVVGGEGMYPLIMRKAKSNDQAVYYAELNARQDWSLVLLSENLHGFLLGIAEYIKIYQGSYKGNVYKGNLWDDDYDLDPKFADEFSVALNKNPATFGRETIWLRKWLGL